MAEDSGNDDEPAEDDEEYGQNQYGGDAGEDAVEQTERMDEEEDDES